MLLALPYMVLGGVDTLLSQVCAHLRRSGVQLTIVTTGLPMQEQGNTVELYARSTSEIYHLPSFLPEVQRSAFLQYLIASRGITTLWIAGSDFIYQSLPSLHDRFPTLRVVDSLFNTSGHTASNRHFAHHIDLTLAESTDVRDWLVARGEWPDRIKVIPNGVDVIRFHPADRESARIPLPAALHGKFVVGFLGRFSEEKAPDDFVRLAAEFRHRSEFHFVLAGAGPLESNLRVLAATLGVTDNLLLPGTVAPELWLPACDVLVLPSRLDGRPNIVLEALACGVPVIATEVGGLPEMIYDGRNGFLVKPGELAAVERILVRLRADASLLARMKTSARETALAQFDIRRSLDQYGALFAPVHTSAK